MAAHRNTKHILIALASALPDEGPANPIQRIDIRPGLRGSIFIEVLSKASSGRASARDRSVERQFRSAVAESVGEDVFVHWTYADCS